MNAEKGSPSKRHLRFCKQDHGGESNAATVYGHHGSVRVCIRLYGGNAWVYDPRWERPMPPASTEDGAA